MRTMSAVALKDRAETLRAGSSAVMTIAMLLRANNVESADEDGAPFLTEFTKDGLFAALDVIGTAMSSASELLLDVIQEACDVGVILDPVPAPQPVDTSNGGGA